MSNLGWFGSWIASNFGRAEASVAPQPEPEPPTEWTHYSRLFRVFVLGVLAIGVLGGAGWLYETHSHKDWAVLVVAADWHAHDGGPSEAFDNARRDISAELRGIGFDEDNMLQFSVRPERYPDAHALVSDGPTIANALSDLTNRTQGGCLIYFTSHGAPWGMVLGNVIVSPGQMAHLVDDTCGNRPTVVIISSCYSGIFVPALSGENRMIMTAARADRASFGCGQDNRYTYFDACVVQNLPGAHGFPELADRVKDCVSKREVETGASPPSEPQVSIGSNVAANLPRW
ncbi:MAG TPA: C13 family peptidase [Rhizomicrobium sp.]